MRKFWLRLLLGATLLVALTVVGRADAEKPTLSGRWSASAMRVSWNIGDWGKNCGPKPGGAAAPAGTVTIVQQGGELRFSGAGRSYSTTQCWEQFPGLARVSHSGGKRGWRNVCKTSGGDARQATVVTNITATDSYIVFNETGQYQFVIKGQNCTASARRSRSFKLIQREGEPPPKPAAPKPAPTPTVEDKVVAPKPKPKPAAAPKQRCDEVGPPARLEVRPSRKLMRPGETFAFRGLVLDAKGCVVSDVAPTWRLKDASAPAKLVGRGKIRVNKDAPETEVALSASVGGRAVKVVIEIASRERYEALLRQRGFDESGESSEAAVAVIASGSIGAGAAVAQDQARTRKRLFAAIVGALALVCGAVGLVMVRRNRKRRVEARKRVAADEALSAPPPPAPRPRAVVCPTCRQEFPPDAIFCPNDRNQLVPVADEPGSRRPAGGICPVCGQGFDPGVRTCPQHNEELIPAALYMAKREVQPKPTKKICPVCGHQYEGDVQFCGTDGATLVPIN